MVFQLDERYVVTSPDQLSHLYEPPTERAVLKQLDYLDDHSRAFIAAAPFMLLATSGPFGVDCSPRGDQPGFVRVVDEKTLLIPDRRGNNRIDSITNIVRDPAVGLLFMIPGVNETFRVNGRAFLSNDPTLLAMFVMDGKLPKAVIVVTVNEAFAQCARALVRSDLWNPAKHVKRSDVPTMGTMLAAHTGGKVDAPTYDAEAAVIVPQTLY